MKETNEQFFKEFKRIQKEINVPKGQYNNFGKYKYRSLEDITEAFKKIDTDLCLTLTDQIEQVGERYYVVATAELTDGKTSISNRAYARESESKKGADDAQVTGGASSYARKYALNGLFCIDDVKDPDATNNHNTKIDKKELYIQKLLKMQDKLRRTELEGFSIEELEKLGKSLKENK